MLHVLGYLPFPSHIMLAYIGVNNWSRVPTKLVSLCPDFTKDSEACKKTKIINIKRLQGGQGHEHEVGISAIRKMLLVPIG